MGRSFPAGRGRRHRGAARSSPTIRRRIATSPPSWCGISSPTIRRRTRCAASKAMLRDTRGDLGAASAGTDRRSTPPGSRGRNCARRWTSRSPVCARWMCRRRPPPDLLGDRSPASANRSGPRPQPNGWPDRAADWAGPEAMLRRIDWAYARRRPRSATATRRRSPTPASARCCRPATLRRDGHAGSRRDALTLLLTSPEFQRR